MTVLLPWTQSGAAEAPLTTMVALSALHNFTPLGFFAEAAPRRWLGIGALLFIGGPLLLASGLPFAALQSVGLIAPEWTLLPTGPLADHLGVYLPGEAQRAPWALYAFSGLVFAQVLHYGAVLHGLPRLAGEGGRTRWRVGLVLAAIGALTLLAFAFDFRGSRQLYGIAAAVHAWLEVPVLLAALLQGPLTVASASTWTGTRDVRSPSPTSRSR